MAPTTYEIICTFILCIVAFWLCGKFLPDPNDYIDITPRKLKEWEKQERKWK